MQPKCHEEERYALLEFKATFYRGPCQSGLVGTVSLTLWTVEGEDGDCCYWDGVECDEHSGHVIGLILLCGGLSGSINSNSSIFKLGHLRRLDLSYNDFHYSKIPSAIGNLSQLEYLNLADSNFRGQVPSEILHLVNLSSLDLSDNQLTLMNPSLRDLVQSLVRLEDLDLTSVEISSSVPDSLSRLTSLRSLSLANCKLQGQLPPSVANLFFQFDNVSFYLSHNHSSRFEGNLPLSWGGNLTYLDLRFNQLKGSLPIPSISSSLEYYLVSNNEFSGELPTRVCNLVNLTFFDIGNNVLSGIIPQCLTNLVGMGKLSVLNLQHNNFSGPIPQLGKNRCNLVMIDMNYNQLEGPVPRDLENCTNLEFLDLGNNNIIDVFPFWLGKLPDLSILILRRNRFHGIIEKPSGGYEFPQLQIIDLSNNNFTGHSLARYFEGWTAMKVDAEKERWIFSYASIDDGISTYFYAATMTERGMSVEYTKIPESLIGIDFSNNYFTGEIPKSIATLKGLRFLNLSNNMLTGSIPFSLNGLTKLEFLDFSHNKLSGEIPQQLTDISTLSFFDVSFNQLTGPIPQSKQFNTFESSSYQGNPSLCGFPLSRKCGDIIETSPPPSLEKDDASNNWFEIDWMIVSMGYASGFVIGAVVGMNWRRGCKRVKRVRQIRFVLS